mmetsp:Transcript_21109/g.63167  ORF Transcript_21109/g.63167 Transcript_21109/m.63167 type:complete len:221 (-) Transcript_21109:1463-2125(-)
MRCASPTRRQAAAPTPSGCRPAARYPARSCRSRAVATLRNRLPRWRPLPLRCPSRTEPLGTARSAHAAPPAQWAALAPRRSATQAAHRLSRRRYRWRTAPAPATTGCPRCATRPSRRTAGAARPAPPAATRGCWKLPVPWGPCCRRQGPRSATKTASRRRQPVARECVPPAAAQRGACAAPPPTRRPRFPSAAHRLQSCCRACHSRRRHRRPWRLTPAAT